MSGEAPDVLVDGDGVPGAAAFSLDSAWRHLNHGSYGAVPRAALEEQRRLFDEMNAGPGVWFGALPPRVRAAREHVATFLGAAADATAFVPNASAGVTVVLQSLALPAGARVVLTDHAYGAVRMACERAVRAVGGSTTTVHVPLDATDEQVVESLAQAAVTPSPAALVVVDHITSPTARVIGVAALSRRLREVGVPLLVDAAHVPAQIDDPLAGFDGEYWVGNLHKWGCSPRGTAALVAAPDAAQALHPLIDSWGAPDPYPARFDRQGTTDLTPWLATPRALDDIERRLGWDRVRRYQQELVGWAADAVTTGLAEAGGEAPVVVDAASQAPAMRLVPLPAGLVRGHEECGVLTRGLNALGFQVAITYAVGHAFLRLSAHAYNTAEDYLALCETGVPWLVAAARARAVDPDGDLAAIIAAIPQRAG